MDDRIVQSQWGLYTIHLMRRSRCFVLDNFARTARFLLRQNQSVQLRLICIYVCPTSAQRGFRYGNRRYKYNTFILKATLFGRQSITSKLDLTLLNSDMSKKHTFACFFLAHPTFRVTRQSCSAYSHSLKYLSFLNPYALCFITFILLFIPSSLIVQI